MACQGHRQNNPFERGRKRKRGEVRLERVKVVTFLALHCIPHVHIHAYTYTLTHKHTHTHTHKHTKTDTVYRHTPLSLHMYLKFRRSCRTPRHNIESRDHWSSGWVLSVASGVPDPPRPANISPSTPLPSSYPRIQGREQGSEVMPRVHPSI